MNDSLLIASNNPKKIKEMKEILGQFFGGFTTFKDHNIVSPEETGTTFEENSLIKARVGCQVTGLVTLADDSGLCVDYLNGAPGVYSSRYAQEGEDKKNYEKLLKELAGVELDKRSAYFISTVAVVFPNGKEIVVEGKVHGFIIEEPRGENGFGYDPIFFLPEFNCTMAELSNDKKNEISHRGIALQKLKEILEGAK